MNSTFKNKIKGIVFLLVIMASGIGVYCYNNPSFFALVEQGPIYQYNKERDHDAIIELFELERFWLTVSDYDPVFMLKYMAPYKGIAHKDTLHVWVAREGSQFVGFTACYFDGPGIARVLFLATRPEFRGKGYGKKLIQHALAAFKKLDADKVTLVTRTINFPAQKLYNSVGFTEVARDQGENGHVYYEYNL